MEKTSTNMSLSTVQKEYNDEVILKERLLELPLNVKDGGIYYVLTKRSIWFRLFRIKKEKII